MTYRSKRAGECSIGLVLAALLLLALFFASGPASQAQDTAEDEVRAMLEHRGKFGAAAGGFQLAEPFRLERADGGAATRFEVVLPRVKFIAADGTRLELGDVNLNVTVLGEGRFEMSGELPAEIVFRESEGATAGRVSVREHRFKGVWNRAILQFETLDWQSGAWKAFDSSGVEVATVSSASVSAKLEPTSQTHGDGVAVFELRDMSISADGDLLHIERIVVNAATRNSDLVGYGKLLEDLAGDPVDDPADPNTAAALNDLILSNVRLLGDVDYLMRIEGLLGRFGSFGTNIDRFSVELMEFGFGIEGFDKPAGTIRLRYGHRGVDLPIEDAPPGVVPHSVALRLSLQNIPAEALAEALVQYFDLVGEDADPTADAALGDTIVGLLTDAGSLLAIEEVSLESDTVALNGHGTVGPGSTSEIPVTGKGRITIHGLESLQRELLRDLSAETLTYVAILGIFIALGEEIEDERGRAFVYNLEVSPDGNLLINGEDFAPLIEEMILP